MSRYEVNNFGIKLFVFTAGVPQEFFPLMPRARERAIK
jgi:hypothetical protein